MAEVPGQCFQSGSCGPPVVGHHVGVTGCRCNERFTVGPVAVGQTDGLTGCRCVTAAKGGHLHGDQRRPVQAGQTQGSGRTGCGGHPSPDTDRVTDRFGACDLTVDDAEQERSGVTQGRGPGIGGEGFVE
jgi:hypothetical protein